MGVEPFVEIHLSPISDTRMHCTYGKLHHVNTLIVTHTLHFLMKKGCTSHNVNGAFTNSYCLKINTTWKHCSRMRNARMLQ